ncbi:MAG: O-antigen ligase family protein [Romboutsia sp.]|nr:O-antigen ligase family protein [Romboutsia sp.]
MRKVLIFLVVVTLSLAQLTNISRSSGLNIYIFDIVVILFSMVGTIDLLLNSKFIIPKSMFLYLIFFLWAFISIFLKLGHYNQTNYIVSIFYCIRLISYYISAIYIFNLLETKKIETQFIYKLIIASGLLIFVFGLIQLLVLPDFEVLDPSLGWDPHKNRLSSTFFDPNFVGVYFVVCLALLFESLFEKKFEMYKYKLQFKLTIAIIFAIGVLLTFSRSAWLMLGVVLVVYGIKKAKTLLLVSIIVALCAYLAVPRIQTRISGITDPSDSAHFRLLSWKNTYDIAKDNIIIGVGYNAFRYAQIENGIFSYDSVGGNSGAGSDSSMLFVLATTGLVGLAIYILAYFYPLFRFKSTLVSSLILGLLLNSQFINSLFYPQILFMLLVTIIVNEYSYSKHLYVNK